MHISKFTFFVVYVNNIMTNKARLQISNAYFRTEPHNAGLLHARSPLKQMHCGQTGKTVLQSRWPQLSMGSMGGGRERGEGGWVCGWVGSFLRSWWFHQWRNAGSGVIQLAGLGSKAYMRPASRRKVISHNAICHTMQARELTSSLEVNRHWVGKYNRCEIEVNPKLVLWSCKCEYKFVNVGLERCWTVGH